jgi:hypothetical protein
MQVKLGIRAFVLLFMAGWLIYSLAHPCQHLAVTAGAAMLFGMALNDVRAILLERRREPTDPRLADQPVK